VDPDPAIQIQVNPDPYLKLKKQNVFFGNFS
jgi:hypothetical protein